MALQWLIGLYAPAKDVVTAGATRRSRGLVVEISAEAQGARTWITVTAQCKPNGQPVMVRTCRAELYAEFGGCIGPKPVRTSVINLLPSAPVTVRPGEMPARWEAIVLNERLRRDARKRDHDAITETFGKETDDVLGNREKCVQERKDWLQRHPMLEQLVMTLSGPRSETIRAVLDSTDGRTYITSDIEVPPSPPFTERLDQAIDLLRVRRRATH